MTISTSEIDAYINAGHSRAHTIAPLHPSKWPKRKQIQYMLKRMDEVRGKLVTLDTDPIEKLLVSESQSEIMVSRLLTYLGFNISNDPNHRHDTAEKAALAHRDAYMWNSPKGLVWTDYTGEGYINGGSVIHGSWARNRTLLSDDVVDRVRAKILKKQPQYDTLTEGVEKHMRKDLYKALGTEIIVGDVPEEVKVQQKDAVIEAVVTKALHLAKALDNAHEFATATFKLSAPVTTDAPVTARGSGMAIAMYKTPSSLNDNCELVMSQNMTIAGIRMSANTARGRNGSHPGGSLEEALCDVLEWVDELRQNNFKYTMEIFLRMHP